MPQPPQDPWISGSSPYTYVEVFHWILTLLPLPLSRSESLKVDQAEIWISGCKGGPGISWLPCCGGFHVPPRARKYDLNFRISYEGHRKKEGSLPYKSRVSSKSKPSAQHTFIHRYPRHIHPISCLKNPSHLLPRQMLPAYGSRPDHRGATTLFRATARRTTARWNYIPSSPLPISKPHQSPVSAIPKPSGECGIKTCHLLRKTVTVIALAVDRQPPGSC